MKKLFVMAVAAVAASALFGGNALNVPSNYATIADAVAVAGDGDEIVLAASETPYALTANLVIPKGVTVRGATGNRDDVLVAPGTRVITLGTDNSTLADLTVMNANASGDTPKMGVVQITNAKAQCVNFRTAKRNIDEPLFAAF